MLKKILPFLFLLLTIRVQAQLTEIKSFGDNPGNLRLLIHFPSGDTGKLPLVVVLHGCNESAQEAALGSGWNDLADRNGFAVLYPEQKMINNGNRCFNWFMAKDQQYQSGEPASIIAMIRYAAKNYALDTSRIFVTGLSAGAVMANALLVLYPDLFKAGALFAGGPFGATDNLFDATAAMNGNIHHSPAEWGALARKARSGFSGTYPRLMIFQGENDFIVSPKNARELVGQWTNLHHADTLPDDTGWLAQRKPACRRSIYTDSSGQEIVVEYRIAHTGHTLPIDTGSCPDQSGTKRLFASPMGIPSTAIVAGFFGLLKNQAAIAGPVLLAPQSKSIAYTLPAETGASYAWTVPPGASIVSGQNSNSIRVDFGKQSGCIRVIKTSAGGCTAVAADVFVRLR